MQLRKPMRNEVRTPQQVRRHYEIEKQLAARLRTASKQERGQQYSALYDQLLRRVPDHPMLLRKASAERTRRVVAQQMGLLNRYLKKDTAFLEVGAGDCALSLAAAAWVRQVYAVDVCQEISKGLQQPPNFRLALSDGCSIPVPPASIDVAFSNQLMEHLHPDDACEQLRNIAVALSPRGVYVCITPNRLTGPHDVSRYFDEEATGFHLKEYTFSELKRLFGQAGFSKIRLLLGARGVYLQIPAFAAVLCERLLLALPRSWSRPLAGWLPIRLLLGVRIVGIK